jgi:hypothetical protein
MKPMSFEYQNSSDIVSLDKSVQQAVDRFNGAV